MTRILSCALTVMMLLSLFGCEEKELSASFILESSETVTEIQAADIEVTEQISKLVPRYIIENNRPYISWNEIDEADKYKVTVKRESQTKPYVEITTDREIDVFPGETVSYQVVPLAADGREMTEHVSDTLEVNYTVMDGPGGIEEWVRPDNYYSYRSKNEFPIGLYWSHELAHEIASWLKEVYTTEYLLGGYIAEIDQESGEWLAPMTPGDRVQPEWVGTGLDCVGFVNGFYYLYTQAFAGEDYKKMDVEMDETYGVYGSLKAPTATLAYLSYIVIKPALAGSYADASHIRPGDICESRDHAWIVSDEGEGFESKLWEYEHVNGFSGHRTIESVKEYSPDNPYDYWTTVIANPLESYGKIKISAVDESGHAVAGGSYRLKDLYDRTMALEDKGTSVELYRPDGDEFVNKSYTMDESDEFYDEASSFVLPEGETSINRVIGGRYVLEEIMTPEGYEGLESVSIEISPGEEKVIFLVYNLKQ